MIGPNEFPNALFSSITAAFAGYRELFDQRMRAAKKRQSPPMIYLKSVRYAIAPDGRVGYVNFVEYTGIGENVYGPGGTGDSQDRLEARGWKFQTLDERLG